MFLTVEDSPVSYLAAGSFGMSRDVALGSDGG